jgi:hypothetical protein
MEVRLCEINKENKTCIERGCMSSMYFIAAHKIALSSAAIYDTHLNLFPVKFNQVSRLSCKMKDSAQEHRNADISVAANRTVTANLRY